MNFRYTTVYNDNEKKIKIKELQLRRKLKLRRPHCVLENNVWFNGTINWY